MAHSLNHSSSSSLSQTRYDKRYASHGKRRPYEYPVNSYSNHQGHSRSTLKQQQTSSKVHHGKGTSQPTHYIGQNLTQGAYETTWDTRGVCDTSFGSGSRSVSHYSGSNRGGTNRSGKNGGNTINGKNIVMLGYDAEVEIEPNYKRETSCNVWVAFILHLVQMVLTLTVFFAPALGQTKEGNESDLNAQLNGEYGFWLVCYHPVLDKSWVSCRGISSLGPLPAWFTICQVFSVMFTVLSISVFVMLCFYAFRRQSRRKWPLSLGISIVGSINALLQAVVVILFAINFLDETWWCCPNNNQIDDAILFWGWYLAAVALLFQVVAVIMMIVETVNLRR